MKYFIYCRRSQDREDKQVLSVESQKRELAALASKLGLDIVDVITEEESAYKRGRKHFNEMMNRIEDGDANGILVFHLTRLARNAADGGLIISFIDENKIKEIRTVDSIYTNSSDSKFMMSIHFAMAKKSSDDTSTFVKNNTKTKVEHGEFPGTVAYGYLNIGLNGVISGNRFDKYKQIALEGLGRPLKRVEQDPVVASLIRKLMDMALSGAYTLTELREEAYKLGIKGKTSGRKLSKSSLQNILTNIFYTGKFKFNGVIYQGIHEPIITEKEFERIQGILKYNGRIRTTKHDYLFAGLLFCGTCGGLLSGDYQKGHHYYRCARTKGSDKRCSANHCSRQSDLEVYVFEAMDKLTIPESIVQWSLKFLKQGFEKECLVHTSRDSQLHENLQQERGKLERLTAKWLSPSNVGGALMSDEEYVFQKRELQKNITRLEEGAADNQVHRTTWISSCEAFFIKLRDLRNHYDSLDGIDKRILLKDLGVKMIRTHKQVRIEANEPLNQILNPELAKIPSEPELRSMGITKKDLQSPEMINWLPRLVAIQKFFMNTSPHLVID